MSKYGWTDEQDKILADTVISYMNKGKTRLAAFEIAGAKLLKTENTCRARWNTVLRDKYNIPKEELHVVVDPNSLGHRIRTLRIESGLTQEELANKLQLSNGSVQLRVVISYYELNRSKPPIEAIVKMSDFFNVSCDYLLRGEEFQKR